jgi:ABC-type Fe3+-siderophore transport system permease subunit
MTPPLHAPSPTPSTGPASRRRRALLVPVLAAVSGVLLTARLAWASDTFQNCRYLGPSARMYITSWAGLACAVATVVTFAALPRSERRGIAASAVLGMLLAFVLLMTIYWLYTPDPSGGDDCSGLGLFAP